MILRVCSIALLVVAACGDDATAIDPMLDVVAERAECENLDPTNCLTPFPTMRYLVEDPTTNTGFRVDYPLEALPTNQYGDPVSSDEPWNRRFDGFSPAGSALMAFPGKLDTTGLPHENRIELSVTLDSPTILLDAETGELVGHYSETNEWNTADLDRDSLFIRPATRLQEDHRYIVAIRRLRYRDGTDVVPSDYFRALRDDIATDVPELEDRRAAFEEIFGLLEDALVPRHDLIIAWDYRTASGENAWGEAVRLRDDAYERIGEDGLGCTVTRVDEDVTAETYRRVRGTFTSPLYMETQYEGTVAHRDDSGRIAFNGMHEAPFEVVIPYSVRDRIQRGDPPGRVMMYGHGLLGTSEQVNSGGTRSTLQEFEIVGFGTDYYGLSYRDENNFGNNVVTDFGNANQVFERLLQGTVNSLVVARSFRGVCAELPELQIDGRPAYDPDQMYYYGISQGGLMGTTIAGLTTDIERFVLQVGAMAYSVLMRRSTDFDKFERFYVLWYPDMVDRDWFIVSTQSAWDYTDPATYVGHLVDDALPDTPLKRILYQTSRYDTEVANVQADAAMRTAGIPWFRSSSYEPWNMGPGTDGPEDSGYIIYHLDDVEPIPIGSQPFRADNNAHSDLRYMAPMREQLDRFMQPDGRVHDTCPDFDCNLHNTRRD